MAPTARRTLAARRRYGAALANGCASPSAPLPRRRLRLAALAALSLASPWGAGAEEVFAELVQSADGPGVHDRLARKPSVRLQPDFPWSGPVVEVDGAADQEILGFGGAFTEAAALLFRRMAPSAQEQLLELFFGADGLGFTLGRVPIGSCDFSPTSYSFDDTPGDYGLADFDRNVTHDTEAMIPFIRAAMERLERSGRSLRLIAAPWSPPGWMKQNGRMDGQGPAFLRDGARSTWAKYISLWISAYERHGVRIWAVTPQNEPENYAVWEGCVYSASQEMAWVGEFLGPTLRVEHPDVQLFVFDHNKDHVYEWAQAAYSQPSVASFVSGVAFHWYAGDYFDQVRRIHAEFPKATLLATEATYERYRWRNGTDVRTGDWDFGLGYAHNMVGDMNAGAAGWLTWNLVLDMNGGPNHVNNVCDPVMLTDLQALYVHPQLYAMAHFSKYVPPGSRRLSSVVKGSTSYTGANRPYGTCTADDGLEAAAFLRPDGRIAVVVLNCGGVPITFKLYRRSLGDAAVVAIPAYAIQTWLLPPGAAAEEEVAFV